jgi:hypothetical protein
VHLLPNPGKVPTRRPPSRKCAPGLDSGDVYAELAQIAEAVRFSEARAALAFMATFEVLRMSPVFEAIGTATSC